jgi:murein DD-endopeptidase MepM/ murein hydrolase activator NlpD
MHEADCAARLGDEPPMVADGRSRTPDRREVSVRWLSGTFLTGLTSSILMGVALVAALDGREQLAIPPELAVANVASPRAGGQDAKAGRVLPLHQVARAKDRRRMDVSTLSREGDREVVRMMPFVDIKMALAAGHKTARTYPAFDPLAVFGSDDAANEAAAAPAIASSLIYGAKVESEVALKTVGFPMEAATFDEKSDLSAEEVEKVVRATAAILTDGDVQVASLHYVDPQRFGAQGIDGQPLNMPTGVRIVPENLSVAPRLPPSDVDLAYAEDIIPFTQPKRIAEALSDSGYEGPDASGMAEAIAKLLSTPSLKEGSVIRLGLEVEGDRARIVRASVYDRVRHLLTIALDDRGQYVPAAEPEASPALLTAFDETPPIPAGTTLPTVYDGIYQTAYSYGMTESATRQLVRLLASDVDFQSRLAPSDRLEVFFSQPGEDDAMSDESELLYVSATFGGQTRNFYRFRLEDGTFDYFDGDGRSSRQFLLRNPVPNGIFRSGFGGRRHPILGYVKMHTGVDWAAPRGTPIIAAGNGVVESAGWSGGYGRQTIIRHANGYESSYNHQSAIAKGIKPGTRVRQGQVIGYVGSTGLATGDHLHYELIVNGTKVDPLRVRLPVGRSLSGAELEAFKRERERIDDLLDDGAARGGMKVARS